MSSPLYGRITNPPDNPHYATPQPRDFSGSQPRLAPKTFLLTFIVTEETHTLPDEREFFVERIVESLGDVVMLLERLKDYDLKPLAQGFAQLRWPHPRQRWVIQRLVYFRGAGPELYQLLTSRYPTPPKTRNFRVNDVSVAQLD